MQTRRTRSKNAVALLSSALQPLVDSGFLGAEQVGRIAQICQELNQACLEDSIWASFCHQEYPITMNLPKYKKNKGYRLLYKSWSSPIAKRRPPSSTLGPPSCQPKHIDLCIHIKYNGLLVGSFIQNGRKLKHFLKSGGTSIRLGKPIVLGKAVWTFDDQAKSEYEQVDGRQRIDGLSVGCRDFDESKLSLQIHMYRSTDDGMCCLFTSQDDDLTGVYRHLLVHPEETGSITSTTKFDLSRSQRKGRIFFKYPMGHRVSSGWPLQHSRQAELILEAFPRPVFLESRLEMSISTDGDFCITDILFRAMTDDGDPDYAISWHRRFINDEHHGVTMLHLFSELQAT